MSSLRKFSLLFFFTALLLQACAPDTESFVATEVALGIAQTQQISDLQTAAAAGGVAETPSPETDAEGKVAPSETPTPTITPTPTLGIPEISVSQDTNCRTGPATNYGYLYTAEPDNQFEVVGLWDGGNEYVIIDAGSYTCWLWTRYADNRDFSAYDLPSHSTPATPTPAYDWNSTWDLWWGPFAFSGIPITQNGTSISGSFGPVLGGGTITFSGTLSDDLQTVSGTWKNSANPDPNAFGTFQWQIKSGNKNQFVGSTLVGGSPPIELCGARNGASQPSPCQWP